MNILHCNECEGREGVVHVVVTVERQTPISGRPGLARNDSFKVEGDLCATCLKVVTDAISEEVGLGIGPLERHADYSEVT
jgi:hypothetical protein